MTVAVDDERNAADIAEAAAAAGSEVSVLIEVDIGMGRGGVRSPEAAIGLARAVNQLRGLHFRGVQGYEGHCMLDPDREVRTRKVETAIDYLGGVVDRLEESGIACEVVSAGGTGSYDITANHPRVTEIQAGSYVFMDKFHDTLVPGFAQALTVLGTVVIKKDKTVVLDAGRKSIGVDYYLGAMKDYPSSKARYFAEEHAVFDVDDASAFELGDTVELTPGYAPSTVNLYDAYHVVEGGVVVDIWPVFPRGPGHSGLLTELLSSSART